MNKATRRSVKNASTTQRGHKGGSKRKTIRRNKTRHNKKVHGGRYNNTIHTYKSEASISRAKFDAMVRANQERLEQERLEQERLEQERLKQERLKLYNAGQDDLLRRKTGTPRLGYGALDTLFGP